MPPSDLLIDIGNSRIKWACHHRGELSTVHGEWHHGKIPAALMDGERPQTVLVANVAGEGMATSLTSLVNEAWGLEPRFVKVQAAARGVRVAYQQPKRLGVDRWLGLVAGVGDALCVADLGTATTIDFMRADGEHLGGIIAPGMDMMCQSLIGATAGIADGTGETGFPAKDTGPAVNQGARLATIGLLNEGAQRARQLLGQDVQLVMTGGAAPAIWHELPDDWSLKPDWVLQGLACCVADAGMD